MPKEWKIQKVEELKKLIGKYNVVAIADVALVPTSVLQKLRKELKDTLFLFTKKNLIKFSLDKSGNENLRSLAGKLGSYPMIVLTNQSPFKLSKVFQSHKVKVAVKSGQISTGDITIPECTTPFTPGPAMAELTKQGIKTKIESGKVLVTEAKKVVNAGAIIPKEIAELLNKLEIKPIYSMVKISAVYDNGKIYSGNDVFVDTDKEISNLAIARSQAMALALKAEVFMKEIMPQLLSKSQSQATALAYKAVFITNENKGTLLGTANNQMIKVAKLVNGKNPEALSKELNEFILELTLKRGK
jgi:large subunit ribosomal protein L10